MGHPIPKQHPAVVLRAHYNALRALLAVALLAVVALSATVAIIATDDETANIAPRSATLQPQELNYGGFNPATGKPAVQEQLPPGTRFDGGPDEGTRGIQAEPVAPGTRFDGGPDEGTRGPQAYPQPVPEDGFKDRAGGPPMIPNGPGSR
jgi:hypothetical protein